jgi:hypothetical protein
MGGSRTADRRVNFAFEVDFSNGGGMQGQDLRIGCGGDDASCG